MHNNDVYNVKMLKIPNTFPYICTHVIQFDIFVLYSTFIHFDVFEWLNDVDVELWWYSAAIL